MIDIEPMESDLTSDKWKSFLDSVDRLGYLDFLTAFSPSLIGTHNWPRAAENCPDELALLIKLLLLGGRVDQAELSRLVPDWEILVEIGVCSTRGANVYSPSLALLFISNSWIWVQRPQPNPTIYIGHDTYGLMSRLRVRRGGRFLDLCAGPGTQGLWAAKQGARVISVERNPIAAEVARSNVTMNDLQDRMEVRIGDLYSALSPSDLEFDVIAANPPLLPFPSDHFYPFVGHGGPDGLAVTWRILTGLQEWLSATGFAQIIGTGLSDGLLPSCLADMRTAADRCQLDITVTVVQHVPFLPGTPTFEGLVGTSMAAGSASERTEVANALAELVSVAESSHLCTFSITARRGKGRVALLDLSKELNSSLWFID